MRAYLNRHIQPHFFARLTPYVTYEVVEAGQAYGVRRDIGVWHLQPELAASSTSIATIHTASGESPMALEIPLHLHRVEIRTTAQQQLVTVIEILSPVNKRPGHQAYLAYRRKRRDLLRSEVHLLEIDLLRGGERPLLERPVPTAVYYVVLSRAERRPKVEVWPIQLWDRLPVLPVPLLAPDPDVALDLGAAVASVYEPGAYAQQIDYHQSPPPAPLPSAEAEWLAGLLRQA